MEAGRGNGGGSDQRIRTLYQNYIDFYWPLKSSKKRLKNVL